MVLRKPFAVFVSRCVLAGNYLGLFETKEMSLAHRIIPVLLTRHGHLVKGKQFDSARIVGNAQQAAEIYQSRAVDELIVLDVAATPEGRGPDIEFMARLTECCFMPVTVGGGITTVEQVRQLLANGADKVVIGTAASSYPGWRLVNECAEKFGSQAIVVAIDAARTKAMRCHSLISKCGTHNCYEDAVEFAAHMNYAGAGELIVTNVDRDGTMQGYDLALVKAVSEAVDIPVIANGGCGKYLHMHQALKAGASAVAAGAMFQWEDSTPHGAAEYLAKKGWEVRL